MVPPAPAPAEAHTTNPIYIFIASVGPGDLEGIVAKRKKGIYKDDGNSWLKVKNWKYSQAEGGHELLTRRLMRS